MGQVSRFLRRADGGYLHWCPGCTEPHFIPVEEPHPNGSRWTFNGDVDKPTFSPSVHYTKKICHYWLRDGQLQFLSDSTHALRGQTVPLPELPEHLRDSIQKVSP